MYSLYFLFLICCFFLQLLHFSTEVKPFIDRRKKLNFRKSHMFMTKSNLCKSSVETAQPLSRMHFNSAIIGIQIQNNLTVINLAASVVRTGF